MLNLSIPYQNYTQEVQKRKCPALCKEIIYAITVESILIGRTLTIFKVTWTVIYNSYHPDDIYSACVFFIRDLESYSYKFEIFFFHVSKTHF